MELTGLKLINTETSALGGAGIQTAALAFGGFPVTGATEEWNIGPQTITFTDS